MKTLLALLLVVVLALTSAFAQSSKKLEKMKKNELKERGSDLTPQQITEISQRYDSLIIAAMIRENENNGNKKGPKIAGANISYVGERGEFSGKSTNVEKGANAYATVVQSDANAYFVRKMADGATAPKVSAPDMSMGLEGIISNQNRYSSVTVEIRGANPGSNYYKKFRLLPAQNLKEYLMPGNYMVVTTIDGRQPSNQVALNVSPNYTTNFEGNNLFWMVVNPRR